MQAGTAKSKSASWRLRLMLMPAVAVAGVAALPGTASAQTAFQAGVGFVRTLPEGPCPNGALYCGTATIAGRGPATWDLYVTGGVITPTSCGSTYSALSEFTLASDGSTLVLDEHGYICAPGQDGNGFFAEGPNAFGHPNSAFGAWTVDTAASTGLFRNETGSGTDVLHIAGAEGSGSYAGTLGG